MKNNLRKRKTWKTHSLHSVDKYIDFKRAQKAVHRGLWDGCWHNDACGKHRTLWWITKGSWITLFQKQTRPHLCLLLKALRSNRGNRRHGWGESNLFSGLSDSLLIFLTEVFTLFFPFSLRFQGCRYLFTSVHVFFKIPYSHDAFQAVCPASHKANLTVEEGLPHHKHLEYKPEENL